MLRGNSQGVNAFSLRLNEILKNILRTSLDCQRNYFSLTLIFFSSEEDST